MNPNKLLIASRINELRIESGLTQEELGKKLCLNKSTIQRYEKGKIRTIKKPIIEAIANYLNVNPDWLLGVSEEKQLANISSNLSFLQKYNQLNDLGKEKTNEYVDILIGNENYTKEGKKTVIDFNDKVRTVDSDDELKAVAYGDGNISDDETVKHT